MTVGCLNFGVSYGIVYTTETVLPSGLVSVLWAVFPLMMAASGQTWEQMATTQGTFMREEARAAAEAPPATPPTITIRV